MPEHLNLIEQILRRYIEGRCRYGHLCLTSLNDFTLFDHSLRFDVGRDAALLGGSYILLGFSRLYQHVISFRIISRLLSVHFRNALCIVFFSSSLSITCSFPHGSSERARHNQTRSAEFQLESACVDSRPRRFGILMRTAKEITK